VAHLAAPLLAIAWLYAGTVSGLAHEWVSSPDASYGFVLVGVAMMLAWRRRAMFLSRLRDRSSLGAGLLPLLFAVGLYVIGSLAADVFITRVSSVAVVAATTYFLAGPSATRVMAAPLTFLLIAIPPPTLLVNAITLPLQLIASRIAETTLMAAGTPVFRDGNVLQLPSVTLEVAEACSGLRSLVSLGALAVLVGWAMERSLFSRAAIIAAAVPIAVVVNGLRVALTGTVGELWGPHMVTGTWHTFTGWLTFVVSLSVLLIGRRIVHFACGPHSIVQPSAVQA
jgi:exosortase